jgi:hypothetical protein
MNWSGFMKSTASRNRPSHIMLTTLSRSLVVVSLLFSAAALAKPRMPLPPFPPPAPVLYSESFDEAYTVWITNAEVTLGNYTYDESWSGYALQRLGTITPFLVDGVEDTGHTNLAASGAVQFWFKPDWSSISVTNGTGPGEDVPLLEWTALANNRSTVVWSLEASADGSVLALLKPGNGGPDAYLSKTISWKADQWHLLTLDYGTSNTALFIDGKLAAQGAGTPPVSLAAAELSLGSTLTGGLAADGDFDDLYCFGRQLRTNDVALYYEETSGQAALGPVSEAEIQAQQAAVARRRNSTGTFGTMDSGGFSPDYSGGSGNLLYGSNVLWLSIFPPGTNAYATNTNSSTVTVILNNTIADISYVLFSTTNLSSNITWTLEQTLLGSEVTNYTVAIVPMSGRTNLFFKALAESLDSDGDGLPDWWELAYSTVSHPLSPTNADTGNTGIPDGYKQDSAGDGYNNLQKYQMGIPPNVWVTPPAPTSFNVALNTSGTSSTLTWNMSPGPVIEYVILRADPNQYGELGSFQAVATNSATTTSFTDSGSFTIGDPLEPGLFDGSDVDDSLEPGSVYAVEAVYAGGASSASDSPELGTPSDTNRTVSVNLVRGSGGRWQLAFSAIPASIQTLAITWRHVDFILGELHTTQTISVTNLNNGCYAIPDNVITNYLGNDVFVQGIGPNGQQGKYSYAGKVYDDAPYFVDGRQHLQQNLAFLLRAGSLTQAYSYYDDSAHGNDYMLPGSPNFVESSFIHPDLGVIENSGGNYGLAFVLDDLWPFKANYELRGWLYNTNPAPTFNWQPDFATVPAPAVLGLPDPYWIISYDSRNPTYDNPFDPSYWGASVNSTTSISLGANLRNVYGLAMNTALVGVGDGFANDSFPTSLAPGSAISLSNAPLIYYYSQAPAPVLQTVGYYFAPVVSYGTNLLLDPSEFAAAQVFPVPLTSDSGLLYGTFGQLSGSSPPPDFAVTNQTPPLIIGAVGKPMVIGGWAKQQINNGASGKFGYLGQYFETNAYKIGANGTVTTNTTGILSPYGEFFPTEPGPVQLVTMPDLTTGQQGTSVVNVIKMALDVNHDGTMDLTYAGPDNTSADRPFKFWLNSDNDFYSGGSDPGHDVDNAYSPDYNSYHINSWRDLEDYARLWICGMPALSSGGGYQITLYWTNITRGTPSIILFNAVETNGGTAYLNNTNIAFSQSGVGYGFYSTVPPGSAIGYVAPGSPFSLSANYFTNNSTKYFLFEAAGTSHPRTSLLDTGFDNSGGQGELVMAVTQNGNPIASTSVFMDLEDISTMYERAQITETNTAVLSNITSQVLVENALSPDLSEDTNIIVMVHGINVDDWHWKNASETVFKRLYWAGYRGAFATVKWPCNLLTPVPQPLTPPVFNLSELQGYKASLALKSYLSQVHGRFSGYRLNIIAHSQGNAVVSEAIRQGASFDTYILTQGALPDSAYDVNAPTNATMASYESGTDISPEWQPMGYHGIYTNFTGRIVNFYNALDKVLGYWVSDQELLKPSIYFNFSQYIYDGTNSYYVPLIGSRYLVTDPQESRAMVSRSRTLSIGQSGPASPHGVIQSAVDLNARFGFNGSTADEHSAQWTRPIQTCLPYYQQITNSIAP